jgi:hypothetical protein
MPPEPVARLSAPASPGGLRAGRLQIAAQTSNNGRRAMIKSIVSAMLLGSLVSTAASAYFIEWNAAEALSHQVLEDVQTATGPRSHTHAGGILANGLFVQALTETAAAGGAQGGINKTFFEDSIRRSFTIRRSSQDEQLTVMATMTGMLLGLLTRSLEQLNPGVNVFYSYFVVVEGTGLFATGSSSLALGRQRLVNEPFVDVETLAVDTQYVLLLSLFTSVQSLWDGSTATSARADFADPAGSVELGDGLRAEITIVPEPATLTLVALAAAMLAWRRRPRAMR